MTLDLRQIFRDPFRSKSNNVFNKDFEDPTFLTFKLEFGDWGASVMDEDTYKAQESVLNAVNNFNYDNYPLGLLDVNYDLESTYSQGRTPSSGSTNQYYNAVNYLREKNEDTRSEYIRSFIQGLMDIQRNHPYYFTKISGVDKLLEFDKLRGTRLKDAKITIGCLESLDLRMKTLLELYRLGAWDDNYQRWILPDIYRKFKMIIYISEIRRFHMPSPQGRNIQSPSISSFNANGTVSSGSSMVSNIINQIISGPGIYSSDYQLNMTETDYDTEGYSTFPVIAFECSPCEIEISPFLNSGFDIDNREVETTQFSINVENVRIFQRNQLMEQINKVFVSDLFSVASRTAGILNDNNKKFRWMSRGFFTGDNNNMVRGDHNYYRDALNQKSRIEGAYIDQFFYVNGWDIVTDIVNLVSAITSGRFTKLLNCPYEDEIFVQIANYNDLKTGYEEKLRNTATYALQNREDAIRQLEAAREVEQSKLQSNREYLSNILEYTKGDQSMATDYDGGPMFRNFYPLDTSYNIPDQEMPIREVIEQPEMQMVQRDNSYELPNQEMPIREVIEQPDMQFAERDNSYELPNQEMPIREVIKQPDMQFIERDNSYELPEQEMPEREAIEQPDMQFIERDNSYELPEQEMPVREIIEQPDMEMANPDFSYELPEIGFVKIDTSTHVYELNEIRIEDISYNPTVKDIRIEDSEYEPQVKDIQIEELDYEPQVKDIQIEEPDYEPQVKDIHIEDSEYEPLVRDMKIENIEYKPKVKDIHIEGLENNSSLQSIEIEDLSKHTVDAQLKIEDIEKSNNLKEVYIEGTEYEPGVRDIHIEESDYEPAVKNIHIQETEYEPEVRDIKIEDSLYNPSIKESNISDSTYDVPLIKDISIEAPQELPEMTMEKLDTELEIPKMKMVEPDFDVEPRVMTLAEIESEYNQNNDAGSQQSSRNNNSSAKMVSLPEASPKGHQALPVTEPYDTNIPTIRHITIEDGHQTASQTMVKIQESIEFADQTLSKIDTNEETRNNNMKMISISQDIIEMKEANKKIENVVEEIKKEFPNIKLDNIYKEEELKEKDEISPDNVYEDSLLKKDSKKKIIL